MNDLGPVQTQRLAQKYLDEGRHMEALVMTKQGLKHFPAFVVEFSLLLSTVYAARGDRGQARELLTTALTSHPNEHRLREALERLG